MTEPGWLADPTGRHQLRWWDGTRYTDHVADAGEPSTDPWIAAAPEVPPTPHPTRRLPLLVGGAVAAVVVAAGVVIVGRGGGNGTGEFSGEVTAEEPGTHDISVPAGSIIVVRVEPDDDFDARVGFAVSGEDGRRIADLFEDTPFAATAAGEGGEVFIRDSGFEGDRETAFLALPFGIDAAVTVAGFEGSEGGYDISIESFDLDLDRDADGDDVIEAILDSEDVPRGLRQEIEDFIDFDESGD